MSELHQEPSGSCGHLPRTSPARPRSPSACSRCFQHAIQFDDAEVLALDADSLLFTRLLAYRGDRLAHFAFFLRDVYLVSQEPEWLSVPRLLTEGGRAAVFHERFDRWLRADPPAMSQDAFQRFWRRTQSPSGGGLRYGLAYRGRWVRSCSSRAGSRPGFRAGHLELLARAATALGAAFAHHLAASRDLGARQEAPPAGYLVFSRQRRVVVVDGPAAAWLERLADDGLREFGVHVRVNDRSGWPARRLPAQPPRAVQLKSSEGVV